jgi:HlyD family secretion protein
MKRKITIISAIVIVIILAGIFVVRPLLNAKNNTTIQTVTLAKSDLVDSVLVSGTVTSSDSAKVYSKLAQYSVKEVLVEVGQKVKTGDVLAKLDTTALESNIAQAEINVKTSQANVDNEALTNKSNLQTAQNSVELAALDLDNAKTKYSDIKELINTGVNTQDDLVQADSAVKKAQLSYENAQTNLKNAQNKNLAVTKNNLQVQKLSLDELKKNLNDAAITAPIDGTVTMVNAEAGESASGLMFVVEDTDHPIVQTSIGEYDIGSIKLGQEVIIKTDSTGDKEYTGTVTKIAPTALKDQSGNTSSSSDISFAAEVTLKDSDPNIRIGMNARLTIKLSEKKDAFSVPYDAVVTHDDGSEWIEAQDPTVTTKSGGVVYKELPVTTGLETDMNVEIIGTDLKDGLHVVTNPQDIITQTGKLGGLFK